MKPVPAEFGAPSTAIVDVACIENANKYRF